MHRCGAATGDGHAAVEGPEHHPVFGFHIIRIAVCLPDIGEDQLCRCQSIGIGEWRRLLRGEALHRMGQSVHTSGCHDLLRQLGDGYPIQDHIIRNHIIVDDSLLRLLLRHGYDGIAGGFRPGSAGGGNHNRLPLLSGQRRILKQIADGIISYDNKNYTLLKINKKAPLFEENDKTIAIYNDFDKAAPSTIARQSSANFIGNVHHLIEKYSPTNFPILITGETGTGKEKAAALLYKNGPYSNKPYFVIDCSLLNDKKWNTLLKSENSPLNSVHTTIHIKDLGKLSPSNRTKLYTYVKDTGLLKRSRLIFSLIIPDENAGEITNYLINRMSCLLLPIPPLRERSEDLSSIATLYVNQMNALLSKQIVGFSNDAFELIRQYHWPNNLDQFHRVLREAAALTDGSYITNDIVQMLLNQEQEVCDQSHFAQLSSQLDLTKTLDEITYDIIRTVLAEEHNSKEKTAKRLGIGRSTLWRILKNHHGN